MPEFNLYTPAPLVAINTSFSFSLLAMIELTLMSCSPVSYTHLDVYKRQLPTVQGSCQWDAAAVVDNAGNYRTMLEKEYHRYPALIPESPFMDDKACLLYTSRCV